MKTRFLALLLLFAIPAAAQLKNFRISANVNYPLISAPSSTQSKPLTLPPVSGYVSHYTGVASISEGYATQPGFSLGTSFDIAVHPKFYFRSGVIFAVTNFRRATSIESLSAFKPTTDGSAGTSGMPFSSFYGYQFGSIYTGTGEYEIDENGHLRITDITPIEIKDENKVGKTRLLTLRVPFLAGTSFYKGRIGISAGGVFNIIANASVHQLDLGSVNKQNGTDQFTSVSPGAMMVIDYRISHRIAAEISGQHFFSPLYKSEYRQAGKSYLTTLSAGLSYRFAR
jgi:hypothetical protein